MYRKNDNKRKAQTSTVRDAINELLNQYHLKPRFDEVQLIASWPELMGKTISNKTGKIYIRNNVLFVEISSGPLKYELNMSKARVKDIIEKKFGKNVVDDVIFI